MYPAAEYSSAVPWRAALAALCANLVGIGLARFGYTPLIPALIGAHWFAPPAAVYLGAANLAGYLIGALAARSVASRCGAVATLRGAMSVTAASLFACAFLFGFWWFFLWRLISGCTGGVLMALAAPVVMPSIPSPWRGVAGGVIFTGVGLGIAASGTLVPLLMRWGLVETWFGLAASATALTLLVWRDWPAAPATAPIHRERQRPAGATFPLRALYLEYALNAVGLVPHMVFLADFIARGLGRGLATGALYWIVFGAGAVVGPIASGHLGDRIGFRAALRLAFAIQACCIAVPLATTAAVPLLISSFIVGAFVPGIVAITIGRTRELIVADPTAQTAAWAYCTTAFAVGQAIAAYGFSYLFARTDNAYAALFALGAAAVLAALAIDVAAGLAHRRGAA